ncbi:hypothetical protein EV360DRAFT_86855 [Lentinula raphanica]|nr:hypothetical protein EV360DRAFT_86855 [Lentinula raphanica]
MATRPSNQQPSDDFYSYHSQLMHSSYDSYLSMNHPLQQTVHPTAVDDTHHESTSSQLQTRQYVYSQEHESNSFAQFLREDDERFFATFPEAKAAQQPHNQQWTILGNDYRDFHGSAAFSLSANHGTFNAYPSPTSPVHAVHATNVVDVPEGSHGYPSYGSSSSHAPFQYTLDPSSCGSIPLENEYSSLPGSVPGPQDVVQVPRDFGASSFYTSANQQVHPDLAVLQHDNLMPVSPISAHPSRNLHSPDMLRLESPPMNFLRSPSELTEPLFSPMETHHSHMYSLSPEAIIPHAPASPSPPLPVLPSALSPVSMVTPTEQLTLPPLPLDNQSDSEPLADDSSGESSSRTVLPKPSVKRKRRRNPSEELQNSTLSASGSTRNYVYGKIPLAKPTPPPSAPKVLKSRPASSQNDKKSLALACFFCRGRKIACGPQDPNSADRTCNQCRRRSLKCEYPTESRRGMRKRKSVVIDPSFHVDKEHAPKVAISSASSGSKA